ncbi:MAG: alpha/beta hydrolase-fold protein [Kiritimatiellia bacterium]
MKRNASDKTRRITFKVTTAAPLPAGEQIFITGNDEALGNWFPDALPLTRVQDNLWTGTATVAAQKTTEYKITRGSWQNEETVASGIAAPNKTVKPGGDITVENTVARWRDSRLPVTPQITGNYQIHRDVKSKFLAASRDVIVWLPPSWSKTGTTAYPVLYMHDGQQVFDPNTSTWNHAWDVDDHCTELIKSGELQEIIVVAAYSTENRRDEYDASAKGENYTKFIVEELKPFIDKTYCTKPERESTAVAGASYGGAISFYIAWTRPDVFFGAACLSPAFRYEGREPCLDIVRNALTVPDFKCYLYCGNGDPLEKELMPGMRDMARQMRLAGYKDGKNLLVEEDENATHNEESWSKHTQSWLKFLFGAEGAKTARKAKKIKK